MQKECEWRRAWEHLKHRIHHKRIESPEYEAGLFQTTIDLMLEIEKRVDI